MPRTETRKTKVAKVAGAAKSAVAAKRSPPARKAAPAASKATAAEPSVAAKPKEKTRDKPKDKPRDKPKRPKMIRDSFTMPESEYKVLGEVKRACLKAGIEIKKSELLRVGVELIRRMELEKLASVLATLTPLKAGRPKKEK
jgi:hypothetical protein